MERPIPHEPPCAVCGCPYHHYLACECGCTDPPFPGVYPTDSDSGHDSITTAV